MESRRKLFTFVGVALLVFSFFGVPLSGSVSPVPSPNGVCVLVVEDPSARGSLSDKQREAVLSAELKSWLDQNVLDWEIVPAETATTDLRQELAAAHKLPRVSVPWLVVAGPGGGYSGVLESVEQIKKLAEQAK
jgi:hypothetical protein